MINTLKKKILLGTVALLLAATSSLLAEDMSAAGDYYRAKEIDFDAFGTASYGKYTIDHLSGSRISHNTRLGGGVGLSYFFTRYLGIGVDAYSENNTGAFIDSTSLNMTLRLPVGHSGFAPFVYGGGGRQFDLDKVWLAQVGAGIEYRFTPRVGFILDTRWVLPNHTKYYGVARLGVRFAF